MFKPICQSLLTVLLLATSSAALASMRCNGGLINEGDNSLEVLRKCGEPDARERTLPTLQENGLPPEGAVTVERWAYGPRNGMTRYLRFLDGTLVQITSTRD